MQKICVYCASSTQVHSVYFEAATLLAQAFLRSKIELIYGGGDKGLMGCLAENILNGGGKVTGVIPEFMYEQGWHHSHLSSLILTKSMHERKEKMAVLADAVVAMPGGCGTLEELLEIITWKQLGIFTKPIIIFNVNNYFDPLLLMLDNAINEKFMGDKHRAIWQVVTSADEVLPAIDNAPVWDTNAIRFAAL